MLIASLVMAKLRLVMFNFGSIVLKKLKNELKKIAIFKISVQRISQ